MGIGCSFLLSFYNWDEHAYFTTMFFLSFWLLLRSLSAEFVVFLVSFLYNIRFCFAMDGNGNRNIICVGDQGWDYGA